VLDKERRCDKSRRNIYPEILKEGLFLFPAMKMTLFSLSLSLCWHIRSGVESLSLVQVITRSHYLIIIIMQNNDKISDGEIDDSIPNSKSGFDRELVKQLMNYQAFLISLDSLD
jgi:hypothetical protein